MHSFLRGKKLLFVDTGWMFGEILEDYFDIYGAKLYLAKDGHQGLDLFQSIKPDIVLSSLMIPQMNGLEMLKKIRKEDKQAVVVLISPKKDQKITDQAKEHNIPQLIDPFLLEELIKVLSDQYGSRT